MATVSILLASVPLSVALTLTMLPLWRWIEERYRIESIGHSGPSDWCFAATFAACVVAMGGLYIASLRGAAADKGS